MFEELKDVKKVVIGDREYEPFFFYSFGNSLLDKLKTDLLQMRGLMFKSIDGSVAYLFPHKKNIYPIHTFFVKEPITVIYLDYENLNGKIVDIQHLKPFKTYYPKKPSNLLIELKYTPNLNCKIGDVVSFEI